jgi:hypothetical protein
MQGLVQRKGAGAVRGQVQGHDAPEPQRAASRPARAAPRVSARTVLVAVALTTANSLVFGWIVAKKATFSPHWEGAGQTDGELVQAINAMQQDYQASTSHWLAENGRAACSSFTEARQPAVVDLCVAVVTRERVREPPPPQYLAMTLRGLFHWAALAHTNDTREGGRPRARVSHVVLQDTTEEPSMRWAEHLSRIQQALPCLDKKDKADFDASPWKQEAAALLEDAKSKSQRAHVMETAHYLTTVSHCQAIFATQRKPAKRRAILMLQDDAFILPDVMVSDLPRLLEQLPRGSAGHFVRGSKAHRPSVLGTWAFARLFVPPHLQGLSGDTLAEDILVALVVLVGGTATAFACLTAVRCIRLGLSEGCSRVLSRVKHKGVPAEALCVDELIPSLIIGGCCLVAVVMVVLMTERQWLLHLLHSWLGPSWLAPGSPEWGCVANLYDAETLPTLVKIIQEDLLSDPGWRYREIDALLNEAASRAGSTWIAPVVSPVHHLGLVSSLPDEPLHDGRGWLLDHLFHRPWMS